MLDRYFKDVNKHPLLSKDEELQIYEKLRRKGRGTRAAKERLVLANLRLVVKMAYKYEGYGLDLEDLINEGNIGMLKAVDKFNPNAGVKFITYASYWIKQTMLRALENKGRTIRLPSGASKLYLNILKYQKKFNEKKGELPTVAEIAKRFKVKEQRVKDILDGGAAVSSLDSQVGENGVEEKYALIQDLKCVSPSVKADDDDERRFLHECMERSLTKREQRIIFRRFGLKDGEGETLEKVGKVEGVTRERIRQVQKAALEKLGREYKRRKKYG